MLRGWIIFIKVLSNNNNNHRHKSWKVGHPNNWRPVDYEMFWNVLLIYDHNQRCWSECQPLLLRLEPRANQFLISVSDFVNAVLRINNLMILFKGVVNPKTFHFIIIIRGCILFYRGDSELCHFVTDAKIRVRPSSRENRRKTQFLPVSVCLNVPLSSTFRQV